MRFEIEQIKAFLASGHPNLAFGIACLRLLRMPFAALSATAMLVMVSNMPEKWAAVFAAMLH